jgi:hypothetical protein
VAGVLAELETDYLVIGAGASAMAFVDELIGSSDAEVVIVDRRHAAGGHWIDAYPFVQLHQPSAYYGVNSLPLGADRRQTTGLDAGFYERATKAELVAYYERVLREVFLPSGQVRFVANHDYRGRDGDCHVIGSTVSGVDTHVRVRRRLVDATYVSSEIPATHRPDFGVERGAHLMTPNELVHLGDVPDTFTILGGGKTAMDTCGWLLDAGVDPEAIVWVRPRDGWFVDRSTTQPFEQSVKMIEYQARLLEAVANEPDGTGLAHHLADHGLFHRLDQHCEPEVFRGATVSVGELERLRQVRNVVRLGRVRYLTATELTLEGGSMTSSRRNVYVNCTAQGLATSPVAPIFQPDRILIQFTTLGVAPWSAAILGHVAALDLADNERNRLCRPVPRTGLIADYFDVLRAGFAAEAQRRADAQLQAWAAGARLNPGRHIPDVIGEPEAQEMVALMMTSLQPALDVLGAVPAPAGSMTSSSDEQPATIGPASE